MVTHIYCPHTSFSLPYTHTHNICIHMYIIIVKKNNVKEKIKVITQARLILSLAFVGQITLLRGWGLGLKAPIF